MRAVIVLACLACACSKKEPEKTRTEPWQNPAFGASAEPSAAPSGAAQASERYDLVTSNVTFALPAKEQTTRGRVSALSGQLRLPQGKLDEARATITIDLTSLSLSEDSSAFTSRALEWLEIGPDLPTEARERHRQARFELTSVERLVEGKTPGSWHAVAKGQLSLHGFRVPIDQPVALELSAEKVVVRSERPLLVKLAEHDLRPRNAQGHVQASDLPLLGTRIGREARVDFELTFAVKAPGQSQ